MTATIPAPRPPSRFLDRVERFGNALPDPVFIFVGLIGLLVALSVIGSAVGWTALNPATGETLNAKSLLSEENLKKLLVEMPKTLTAFPPLGLVLTVMLGASVAERSGLFATLMRAALGGAPRFLLTPFVVFVGIIANHASDVAYVVYIPLAGVVYASLGRHPIVGIAAAFAGVAGGFSGNIFPGTLDITLLGITQPAARLIDPAWTMNPLGNWYYIAGMAVLFTPIAWFIADKIVEPRLGPWVVGDPAAAQNDIAVTKISAIERRGLAAAWLAIAGIVALYAALAMWPGFTPLIDDQATGAQRITPFYSALVAGFFLMFLSAGWAYGAVVGTIKTHRDVVGMMVGGMKDMAPYFVIVFFAAHFVAMFNWSNLGPILAINAADDLKQWAVPLPVLLASIVTLSSGFDLFIGSASAKWAALAPVAVPMMMLLGVSPEMTTAAYRMGDSVTNIITPLNPYFPLVLTFCQRWMQDFRLGSLLATMLPFSAAFFVAGVIMTIVWVWLGIPVGPGAEVSYTLPTR